MTCVVELRPTAFSFVLFLSLIGTISVPIEAQVPDVSGQMATPIPGVGHHYLGLNSDILTETVNPATGSVSVRLELPTPPARGINIPFALIYNSSGVNQLVSFGVTQGWGTDPGGGDGVGWTYSVPTLTTMLAQMYSQNACAPEGCTNPSYDCSYFANYILQDVAGSRHSLAISNSEIPGGSTNCPQFASAPGNVLTGGDDYYLANTSALTDPNLPHPVTVAGRDGTVYTFSNFYLGSGSA